MLQMNAIMINLHLLTKISGFDKTFRRDIINMMASRFKRVSHNVYRLIGEKRWSACYICLEQYLHDLQPYSEEHFIQALHADLRQLRDAHHEEAKEHSAKRFLSSVELGLAAAAAKVEADLVM